MTTAFVRRPWVGYGAAALLALVVLACGFGRDLRLPGLYMDSINPEYIAVKSVVDDVRADTPTLVLPGNILDGKYPVLAGSYYHGPLQFYLALPVYAALGTDIVSARVVQGLYGALILLGMALVARRYRIRLGFAAAALVLLALDPAFSIALKTQAYNVMWPLLWLFLAIAATEAWAARRVAPRAWQLLCSGFLAGLAFFCYFVFLFFVPVLALYLVHCLRLAGVRDARRTLRALLLNAVGFCVGGAGYLLGYQLSANALGGWQKFIEFNSSHVHKLVVLEQPVTLLQRLDTAWNFMLMALGNDWVSRMVLKSDATTLLGDGKAIALVVVPLLLLAWLWYRKQPSRLLTLCVALSASFFAASLIFGAKISGHHYTLLLPLLYLGIAAGLSDAWPIVSARAKPRLAATVIVSGLALLLTADGVVAQAAFSKRLRATGGVSYFSDAINRYAEYAAANKRQTVYYFPDWGLIMPFVFLTGGREETRMSTPSPEAIARAVCNGSAVEVAYIPPQSASAFATRMRGAPAQPPQLLTFASRDGVPTVAAAQYLPLTNPRSVAACAQFQPPVHTVWMRDPAFRLHLDPKTVDACSGGGLIPVRVDWDMRKSGAHGVAIWVSSDGKRKLWLNGAPLGTATTGAWVKAGVGFEIVDSATGARLATAQVGGRFCR